MDLNKMREMTDVELNAELDKMKKELFNLRFQHVTGQLENPVQMREVKKEHCKSQNYHQRKRTQDKVQA
jgi:large subunit ribosomal protein L29